MRYRLFRWWWLFLPVALGACGEQNGVEDQAAQPLPAVPKVLIIGDSITMKGGYFPGLVERLGDDYKVVHNPGNGGDSAKVRANLESWVTAASPDIIHFNCGLHDLKYDRAKKTNQQPPEVYEQNLRAIVAWLKANTDARLMFALTTPVNEDLHRANKPFDRRVADVDAYNEIARRVMRENGIPINDLHRVIVEAGPDTCLVRDGVHMNEKGNALLADAVAAAIRQLAGRTQP